MPRFQSRLFNWIDRSLPAQLGRQTRRFLDRTLAQQFPQNLKELPRLLAYQTAKAALYPVYLLSKATQQTFPALLRSPQSAANQPLSQPQSPLSLDAVADLEPQPKVEEPDYANIPLLWRPLAKFFHWIERTTTQIDHQISALVQRPSQAITNPHQPSTNGNPNEWESQIIVNQFFAEIWQQEIAAKRDLVKDTNAAITQTAPLGKNFKIEALRRLIAAAIAYFFGSNPPPQAPDQVSTTTPTAANLQGKEQATKHLSNSPKAKLTRTNQSLQQSPLGSLHQNFASETASLHEKQVDAQSLDQELDQELVSGTVDRLARLKALIAAAIDYFIGKRSLTDGTNVENIENLNENLQGVATTEIEQLAGKNLEPQSLKGIVNKIMEAAKQSVANSVANLEQISTDLDPRSSKNLSDRPSQNTDTLQIDDRLERLQRLIEKAVDYFFSKRRSPALTETADITPISESWLTMEDVFGGDDGPWPLPLEYESLAFTRSTEYILQNRQLHSSGELQNSETTTTQIYQHWEEDALIFSSNDSIIPNQTLDSERPLRAWIEAQASVLGYAYNPVMRVVFWVDEIVLRLENLAIAIIHRLHKSLQLLWRYLRAYAK